MSEPANDETGFIESFEAEQRFGNSGETADRYATNMRAFRNWMEDERGKALDAVGEADIRAHLVELDEDRGLAPKTVHARHTALSTFYDWLQSEDEIETDPTEEVPSPVDPSVSKKRQELRSEAPIAVTNEQKEELCDHVPSPTVRNELLIRLMFQTGVREQEAREIRVRDLDRDERSIKVDEAKSNDYRTVYYNDLEPWLSMWLDGGRRASMRSADDSPHLFISNRHGKLSRGQPNKIVKKAARKAGIQETMYVDGNGHERKRITSHALRHGFGRFCVKDGMDISFLKDLMGHENLDTTKQYLAFTDEDRKQAVRTHGPRPSEE